MYIWRCERTRATSPSLLRIRRYVRTRACIKFTYDKLYLTVTHAFCWFFCFINKASYYRSKNSFELSHIISLFLLNGGNRLQFREKDSTATFNYMTFNSTIVSQHCSCFLWCMYVCMGVNLYTRCTACSGHKLHWDFGAPYNGMRICQRDPT